MNELSDQPQKLPRKQEAPKSSMRVRAPQVGGDNPTPGDRNQNPAGISFFQLVAEDFRTHEQDLLEPGFWAVAIHRFGNLRMAIRPRPLRMPFSLLYKILHACMSGFFNQVVLLSQVGKTRTPVASRRNVSWGDIDRRRRHNSPQYDHGCPPQG